MARRHGHALQTFRNDTDGCAQLAERLAVLAPAHDTQIVLVLEPTGGYELALVAFAYDHGWQVCLPNPKQVRDFAKGSGRRAKTDAQDALLLAQFGAEQKPEPQAELPAAIQELLELLHRREDLQQLKRSESNRLLGLQQRPRPAQAVIASLERTIVALEAELAAIEQAIAELLTQNPDLKCEAKRLRSVPGIGERNVLPILVLFYRWRARTAGRGTPKGLVAFVGLDPQPYESGRSVHNAPPSPRWATARCGVTCTWVRSAVSMARTPCAPSTAAWSAAARPNAWPWWQPHIRS